MLILDYTEWYHPTVAQVLIPKVAYDLTAELRLKEDQRVVKIKLAGDANFKMNGIKASVVEFHNRMREHISEKDLEDICIGLTKLNALYDMFLETANKEART